MLGLIIASLLFILKSPVINIVLFSCCSILNKSFNFSLNKMGGTSGGRYSVRIMTFRLVFSSSFEISTAIKSMLFRF